MADSNETRLTRHCEYVESSDLWVAVQRAPGRVLEDVLDLRPDALITATAFDGEPVGRDVIRLLKNRADTRGIPIVRVADTAADVRDTESPNVCVDPHIGADVLLRKVQAVLHTRVLRRPAERNSRATELVEQSGRLMALATDAGRILDDTTRACPGCGHFLEWSERGRVGGEEYDYYHWCLKGCGLYCFNRTAGSWLQLAG